VVAGSAVQLKELQGERVFQGVRDLGCKGSAAPLTSARDRRGASERGASRGLILRMLVLVLILDAVILSMPIPRSSSPSLVSGMSYEAYGPKLQYTEKKKVSPRPPRDRAEGSDERPPTPENGGLATGSAGLAVREL